MAVQQFLWIGVLLCMYRGCMPQSRPIVQILYDCLMHLEAERKSLYCSRTPYHEALRAESKPADASICNLTPCQKLTTSPPDLPVLPLLPDIRADLLDVADEEAAGLVFLPN